MKRHLAIFCLIIGAIALASCSDSNSNSGDNSAAPPTEVPAEDPTAQASSGLPQGDEPFALDPANFVDEIDNPYWSMRPGDTWVFTEIDADGTELRVEVTVTEDTRDIQGISATVVHDVVTEDGTVIEDTLDWYAQDVDGNLWYLGEDTKEYEDGEVVSTAGSWEAGVDGGLAGIIIPGSPEVGMMYRQEHYAGEAEDRGEILSLSESVEVPFGSYKGCLETEDTTPLEPDVLEHKYYCKGVGPVLAIDVASGGAREELISFEQGAA